MAWRHFHDLGQDRRGVATPRQPETEQHTFIVPKFRVTDLESQRTARAFGPDPATHPKILQHEILRFQHFLLQLTLASCGLHHFVAENRASGADLKPLHTRLLGSLVLHTKDRLARMLHRQVAQMHLVQRLQAGIEHPVEQGGLVRRQ